jgi:DNA repair ATPase RecN
LAGYGDLHLHVHKGIVGDRTVTDVRSLDGEEREQEMASMLGTVTAKTRASAHEMLIQSQKDKATLLANTSPV